MSKLLLRSRRTMRGVAFALGSLLLPAAAAANYLYEVVAPELQPYVLLVVDNSGSMDNHDGITRVIGGRETLTGQYADEGEVCIPNERTRSGGASCNVTQTQCCIGSTCTEQANCSDKSNGNCSRGTCKKNVPVCDCPSRLDAAQRVLGGLIPSLENLQLGLERYGSLSCGRNAANCKTGCSSGAGAEVTNQLPDADRDDILMEIEKMVPAGGTPIATSLQLAKEHLTTVASNDGSAGCRKYFVIVVTDGEESCSDTDLAAAVTALRTTVVGTGANAVTLDIRTFFLGFGPEMMSDTPEDANLSKLARLGGTAEEADGEICEPSAPAAPCPDGIGLFALDHNALTQKLQAAFQKITEGEYAAQAPVIATVPLGVNELGRVSRNLMIYTAFRKPGFGGHLYGIRLFEEDAENGGSWEFTDLTQLKLDTCGSSGNPCLYDAGKLLVGRTDRKILTAIAEDPITDDRGGFTLPLSGAAPISLSSGSELATAYSAYAAKVGLSSALTNPPPNLSSTMKARLVDLPNAGGAADRSKIVDWLHGRDRAWPLADIYHSGATVVGAPPYGYQTRGYPQFRSARRLRPDMIYVGANDGMIHAFHAGPDLGFEEEGADRARWTAGEEAWAYLPVSMLARASSAILDITNTTTEPRFFSQDLSCRVDDIVVKDYTNERGELDCGDDESCGWRTVLLCGQGWGGAWYVALDVSDPLSPQPLWESTHDATAESGGMGKSWSVPSVALLNLAETTHPEARTMPTWAAVYGSGYNPDMKDAAGKTHPAYRRLNLPFDGGFAYHGDGNTEADEARVFVQNLADGRFLASLAHPGAQSIVANIPLLDLDGDGFTDVGYVGGWSGQLDRIVFAKNEGVGDEPAPRPLRTHVDGWSNSGSLFTFEDQPFTSSPTLLRDPLAVGRVFLFASGGVDNGSFPDQQSSSNTFAFHGFVFDDDGTSRTPSAPGETSFPSEPNMCTSKAGEDVELSGLLSSNSRLLGSPQLSVQGFRSRWLSFTAWNPDKKACSDGIATLHCLDVSGVGRCLPCGDLNPSVEGDEPSAEIDTGGRKPPPPSQADGQLYFIGKDGPVRVGNQDGKSGGVGDAVPNATAPRTVVVSWREVFEP